jgi:hypothetical protein
MKRILLLVLFSVCAFPITVGAETECPTTPVDRQAGTRIKHKKPAAGISVSTISLTDMLTGTCRPT